MPTPLRSAALLLALCACGSSDTDYTSVDPGAQAAAIDSAPKVDPKPAAGPEATAPGEAAEKKWVTFKDLSLEALGKEGMEDLLDAHLYPEDYSQEELAFPPAIQALHDTDQVLRGYMIPSKQEKGKVHSFLLVGDMLACCFGGAPQADQWVMVDMEEGESCEYYALRAGFGAGTLQDRSDRQ
ncbi:MAG: DUF3299 domain-containing protein [Planctomycetota bacterium]